MSSNEQPLITNPAERLRKLIQRVWSPNDVTVAKHLATVFGVNERNTFALMSRITQVVALVDECERTLTDKCGIDLADLGMYIQPFPKIRSMFDIRNFEQTWESKRVSLVDVDLNTLLFCSEKLRPFSEQVISSTALGEVLADIDELHQSVRWSALDDEPRRLIIDSLIALRRCVEEYDIRGVKRLAEGFTHVVGSVSLAYIPYRNAKDDDPRPEVGLFRRTWAFVSQVGTLIHFAYQNRTQIEQGIEAVKLIGPYIGVHTPPPGQ